jgi:hypothetical protein
LVLFERKMKQRLTTFEINLTIVPQRLYVVNIDIN